MDALHRQLDDLAAALSVAPPPPPPVTTQSLDHTLGGRVLLVGDSACWCVETSLTAVPTVAHPPLAGNPPPGLLSDGQDTLDSRRAFLIDVETGGFSGTPVFLIGLIALGPPPLRIEQWLARDYPEERAILARLAEFARDRDQWVSFNGRCFDEPFLRDRCVVHGISLPPPRLHIDLLREARRRWRGRVPDFRLRTLEQHILGRQRIGDVPAADVPDLFHHFMRTGNAAPLRPVLEHNRLDLIACLELLTELIGR